MTYKTEKGLHLKRNMKTTLTVSLLASMIVVGSMFSLVNASTFEHFSVRSGEQETININLQVKQTVTGSFNVSGAGRGDVIDFWVRDPTGVVILNSGTVADGANFTFTANSDGEYILNFANNVAYNKHIDLEYSVSYPSILDVPIQILGVDPIVFSGIIIAIGVVVAIIAFTFYRKRTKRGVTQPTINA